MAFLVTRSHFGRIIPVFSSDLEKAKLFWWGPREGPATAGMLFRASPEVSEGILHIAL